MFLQMPFILLVEIVFISLFHNLIPLEAKSFFYALSLSIKSFIIFLLPLVIFGLLFKTAVQLSSQASKMIFVIFSAICISNFISTLLSYQVGTVAYCFDLEMILPKEGTQLVPLWLSSLPNWLGNGTAMIMGLALGTVSARLHPHFARKASLKLDQLIRYILRIFIFAIPLFIAGFVIQMNHDQIMGTILHQYGQIFALVTLAVFSYVIGLYFFVSRFQKTSFVQSLKNMMPAAIAGFGSMSSAAAMPLTLLGTEKNAQNPDLAKSIIPATVNIHLIGDCFAIPIFAFAVMKSFGIAEPTFVSYLLFSCYFVLAKFSVAAVPGGGIIVMLPILEAYLGFDATMLSLITALYILFDPVITCANVLGNGAFALLVSRCFKPTTP